MSSLARTLVLIGGISRDSVNKKLYHAIEALNPAAFDFDPFDISRLPYFSQDIEWEPPAKVTEFHERIREADAVLFITPEYNRSFPGVLKNAVDWGSRPPGQNLWQNKPSAVLGASPGSIGTFGAQQHLRQVLSSVGSYVMPQPAIYLHTKGRLDANGKIIDGKTRDFLLSFFSSFESFISHMNSSLRKQSEELSIERERPLTQ